MPNHVWSRSALVTVIVLLLEVPTAASCGETAALTEGAAPAPPSATPFAVVELFTSEGCSSCRPADVVLADIAVDARKRDRRVLPLSFHVDYWDRLGWKDPFSDAGHSERQRRYGSASGSDRVYTPQTVVNGTAEFVGSDRERAVAEIDRALEREPEFQVEFRTAREGDDLLVTYAVTPAPAGAVLNLALVERDLTSKVRRGENAGRTLRHENVVRAFETQAVADDGCGTVAVSVPAGVKPENTALLVYVQDGESMRVIAAAAGADLPTAAARSDGAARSK